MRRSGRCSCCSRSSGAARSSSPRWRSPPFRRSPSSRCAPALPLSPAAWGRFLVMGLLNNAIPFALINWGQTQIDSGLAAILNATTPLFTVLLAHFVTEDERLTRNRIAGVALGFAGVVVMIGPSALRGPHLG